MTPNQPSAVYSAASRHLHWLTAGFVFVMIPVGVIMSDRGDRNIWDATTNALYSGHKLAGFILMFILVARLGWRLAKGAPPDEPTLEPWQKTLSHVVHWAMYALLFGMVVTGWVGVSLFRRWRSSGCSLCRGSWRRTRRRRRPRSCCTGSSATGWRA